MELICFQITPNKKRQLFLIKSEYAVMRKTAWQLESL